MKKAAPFRLVLVTAPTMIVAWRLARVVLAARLAACANLIPRLESHYWWRAKSIGRTKFCFFSRRGPPRVPELERLILARHPYDTPEFVVLQSDSRRPALSCLAGPRNPPALSLAQ